jgi:hypothetical protein
MERGNNLTPNPLSTWRAGWGVRFRIAVEGRAIAHQYVYAP